MSACPGETGYPSHSAIASVPSTKTRASGGSQKGQDSAVVVVDII